MSNFIEKLRAEPSARAYTHRGVSWVSVWASVAIARIPNEIGRYANAVDRLRQEFRITMNFNPPRSTAGCVTVRVEVPLDAEDLEVACRELMIIDISRRIRNARD
ncbi:hypothetical protein FE257_000038 [Aspergillus nanangensis]|uniref:Uncharacterized protein n=1 Tax=Aspergillus nanangensis TaxID=2582783 RepID=A0AAD4GZN0_ASPNN|nr:hypothetical protein FE257_000038 [Aspergillus nanangensis]